MDQNLSSMAPQSTFSDLGPEGCLEWRSSTILTDLSGKTTGIYGEFSLQSIRSPHSATGVHTEISQDPPSLVGTESSNQVDVEVLKGEARHILKNDVRIPMIGTRFRQLKALMAQNVANCRSFTLGGGSFFWDSEEWRKKIPACIPSTVAYYAYALRVVAQLILVLMDRLSDAKQADSFSSKIPWAGRQAPGCIKRIEEKEIDWSNKDSAIIDLWQKLQKYWNILPVKAQEGRAQRRLERFKENMKPGDDPANMELGYEGTMPSDWETDSNARHEPIERAKIRELRELLGSETTPEDVHREVDLACNPYQSRALEGPALLTTGESDEYVGGIVAIARSLGLREEYLSAMETTALPLFARRPATLKEHTINAILGLFWSALSNELKLPKEWPQYWGEWNDYEYAWQKRGAFWPRYPEKRKRGEES